MSYKIHDETNAPEAAQPLLKKAKENYGFVPNLLGVMASSPALLKGYITLSGIFDETSFSPTERQIILLSASYENGCTYCMAAHSAMASMQNVPDHVIEALRNDEPIRDSKLEALRNLTREMVDMRGYPSADTLKAFKAVGYDDSHVLEVVLGVGMKTLSNYTNHMAETPLDEAFEGSRWKGAA